MKNKILFSFITSLAFLFISSSDLKAQDDGSAYAEIRANGTKYSLDIYWKYVGSSNDEEGHYWIYIKNVNLNSKNLTLWERCYKYNNNELWLSKVKLNRETREFQLLQLTKYNLDNVKIVSSVDIEFPKWSSFGPGTIGDYKFDLLDILEKQQKLNR